MKRRQMLLGCALTAATAAPTTAATPGGRIDCQSHLFFEEFLALLEKRKNSPYVYRKGGDRYVVVGEWTRRLMPKHTDVTAKLSDMDANGIAMSALSINDPGPELFGDDSPAMARLLNDLTADAVKGNPHRFFGLATLPFNSEAAMMAEFDRAVTKLGMKGILLYSNLDGKFPDEPQFRPLFAEAEKRGVPMFLHPAYPSTFAVTRAYEGAAGLGLMFDTTIALNRLIVGGVLERHPKLKLVCPHVGGALPYLIGRIDHQTMVLKRGADHIRKAPSEYLKQIWLDAVTPSASALKFGVEFIGHARMLYSSDHPWVDPKLIAGNVESLKLPAAQEAAIFSGNARSLFSL
jgi:predicted TIM-barrel fold metal-dependent hydrolase